MISQRYRNTDHRMPSCLGVAVAIAKASELLPGCDRLSNLRASLNTSPAIDLKSSGSFPRSILAWRADSFAAMSCGLRVGDRTPAQGVEEGDRSSPSQCRPSRPGPSQARSWPAPTSLKPAAPPPGSPTRCTPRGDEPPTETTRPQTRPVIEHAPTCSNFNCRQDCRQTPHRTLPSKKPEAV